MTARTVDDALRRVLDEGRGRAALVGPGQLRLWDALTEATEGGKRFRPALVVATHAALGGTLPEAAVEVGVAVELLHTGFVIHDDVIDDDDVRRGRLNVRGTYRGEALAAGASEEEAAGLARTAGILAGDLALTTALRLVATCAVPAPVAHALLDLFDGALHATAAGELADVRLTLEPEATSLSASLAMEEQKTGVYSFALPLQAGAVLAGADTDTVARLGRAGCLVGVAFQLVDDLLGVFGDPARTGKSATTDLRTRKQTPLVAHARTTPAWEQIRTYLGRPLSDAELAEVRRLLTGSGSRAFVEGLVEEHLRAAEALIEDAGLSAELLAAVTPATALLADDGGVAA
ncbi:MAG: polyprenyl synthetase family protein [Marmoricola sp.]